MATTGSNEQSTTRFEKFTGKNYGLWKWRMQMVLEEKGVWEIVKGEEILPNERDEEELLSSSSPPLVGAPLLPKEGALGLCAHMPQPRRWAD